MSQLARAPPTPTAGHSLGGQPGGRGVRVQGLDSRALIGGRWAAWGVGGQGSGFRQQGKAYDLQAGGWLT